MVLFCRERARERERTRKIKVPAVTHGLERPGHPSGEALAGSICVGLGEPRKEGCSYYGYVHGYVYEHVHGGSRRY